MLINLLLGRVPVQESKRAKMECDIEDNNFANSRKHLPEIARNVSFQSPANDCRARKSENWPGVQQRLVRFRMFHCCPIASRKILRSCQCRHHIHAIYMDR